MPQNTQQATSASTVTDEVFLTALEISREIMDDFGWPVRILPPQYDRAVNFFLY